MIPERPPEPALRDGRRGGERARDRRRQAALAGAATPVAPGGLPGGQYQPLTAEQVARIQTAALSVLTETGVEVMPISG